MTDSRDSVPDSRRSRLRTIVAAIESELARLPPDVTGLRAAAWSVDNPVLTAIGHRTITAVLADALSTGVFVLGPEKGMALVERLPDVEGVIVAADNRLLVSSGLAGKLVVIAPPGDAP